MLPAPSDSEYIFRIFAASILNVYDSSVPIPAAEVTDISIEVTAPPFVGICKLPAISNASPTSIWSLVLTLIMLMKPVPALSVAENQSSFDILRPAPKIANCVADSSQKNTGAPVTPTVIKSASTSEPGLMSIPAVDVNAKSPVNVASPAVVIENRVLVPTVVPVPIFNVSDASLSGPAYQEVPEGTVNLICGSPV